MWKPQLCDIGNLYIVLKQLSNQSIPSYLQFFYYYHSH